MYRTEFWTLWEKARVGCLERIISKHVYYLGWNRSPAQAGCLRQVLGAGALGRPRGIRWRGRWEGGSGWGTHVNPWLIHFSVWQKPLQYCKVISLQLIKINGGKKKPWGGNWGSHSSVCLYLILLLVLSSIPLVAYNIKKNNFTVAYEIEILIIEIRWESQSIMSPYALLSS